ncbi:MAG: hypothetical protein AB7W47_11785 [Calditrichaceae bacterium]
MKKLFFLILLFCLNQVSFSQKIVPYISPGISIGYNFNNGVIYGFKISLGILNTEQDYFYNITFGNRNNFKNNNDTFLPYKYVDFQVGAITEPIGEHKIQLLKGGGVGFLFYKENNKFQYSPRVTAFSGYLVFSSIELNLLKFKKLEPDYNIRAVFPMPLRKMDDYTL